MKKKVANHMSTKKHYVRVMRPVFQRVLIEVDATSEVEARQIAIKRAETLRDDAWDDVGTDFDQPLVIERIATEDELKEIDGDPGDLILEIDHAYALLQADLESIVGEVIPLELLERMDNLQTADVASDWVEQLEQLRAESAEEFWISLKTQVRSHTTLRGLLEELRNSRPATPEDEGGKPAED